MFFEDQFAKPWYPYTGNNVEPKNAKPAKYVVGSGNNTLTITYGTDVQGNGYKFKAVLAENPEADMSVDLSPTTKTLTVTLGTTDNETITADNTKNTYVKIAAEINKIPGFKAVVNGSGVISDEIEADEFDDGQLGTVCPVAGTFIKKSDTEWYVNIAPNSEHDANWRKLTVSTY